MSQAPYDPRFNQPSPFQPQGFPGQFAPPPKSGGGLKMILIIIGSLVGGGGLLLLLCCGGVFMAMQAPKASAAAKLPFNVSAVPIPAFPDRGMPSELEPGVQLYTVPINGQTGGHYSPPGHGGNIYVYLPSGEHQPKSLPCVFIAGAGSNMMEGMDVDLDADGPEHVPYVKAGMAVIAYDLDGGDPEEEIGEVQKFYDFKAACGGVVNARNAIEFALQKVPEVDPNQFYTAGHSSAGACALLVAAHEPRIKGVVAYAPCTDVENFHPSVYVRLVANDMPALPDFLCQSSPKTHASSITCPVFLFHAEADDTVKVRDTRNFAKLLQKHNSSVTLQTVPGGDHYESMISSGLPAGVDWLKQQTGK